MGKLKISAEPEPTETKKPAQPDAVPKQEGPEQLETLVLLAERVVSDVADGRLESPFIEPLRELRSRLGPLKDQMSAVIVWLTGNAKDAMVPESATLRQRLDVAIGNLFTLGRRHKLKMRESGLELVFDLEDQLAEHLGQPRHRAIAYYDETFHVTHKQTTGTADEVKGSMMGPDLDNEIASGEIPNRDALVEVVSAKARAISVAITAAYAEARDVINEPEVPESDAAASILQGIAGLLVKAALMQIAGPVGELVRASLAKRLPMRVDLTPMKISDIGPNGEMPAPKYNDVSHAFSKQINDALSLSAREAVKKGQNVATAVGTAVKGSDGGSSKNKKLFLTELQSRTIVAAANVDAKIDLVKEDLKRMPVEEISKLNGAFDTNLMTQVTALARSKMMQEWVNYTREAGEKHIDARTGAQQNSTPLDALAPAGVLIIHLTLRDDGLLTPMETRLPGVTSAVLDELRSEAGGLDSLKIKKSIQVLDHHGHMGTFEIDSKDAIHAPEQSEDTKKMLATVGHGRAGKLDADAMEGMTVIQGALIGIPRSRLIA